MVLEGKKSIFDHLVPSISDLVFMLIFAEDQYTTLSCLSHLFHDQNKTYP